MKKTLFFGIAAFFASSSAFALQWENCSNADGSLKRVEQEIFGKNPIDWFYKGTKVIGPKVERDEASRVVLVRSVRDTRAGRFEDSTYAIRLTLSRADGKSLEESSAVLSVTDFVICQYHEDPHRD